MTEYEVIYCCPTIDREEENEDLLNFFKKESSKKLLKITGRIKATRYRNLNSFRHPWGRGNPGERNQYSHIFTTWRGNGRHPYKNGKTGAAADQGTECTGG